MANNPLQIFYFDTNIFYRNDNDIREFRRLADANNTLCFYPPRVLIELLSHINSSKEDKFTKYQSCLRRNKILCSDYILPDYYQVLAIHLKTERKFPDFSTDWNLYRYIIIDSKSYADSLQQKGVYKNRGYYDLERAEDEVKKWRDRYEDFWIGIFNRRTKSQYSDENQYPYSLEFKQLFLDTMTKWAGAEPMGKLSSSEIDEFLEPIEAFFSAFKWIIRAWLLGQYGFEKNKNDFHDLTNLIYLGNENLVFITNDKKLLNKIEESCKQKERILTFEEVMERLRRI